MPGKPLRRHAFISMELLLLVLAVALLAAFVLPDLMGFRRRSHPPKINCIANLKQIEGAKQQWALENKKASTDVPKASEVAEYCKGSAMPLCPAGGRYMVGAVGAKPACTIPGHTL